jgi:hypothetical protein
MIFRAKDVETVPTLRGLKEYKGLMASCKEVKNEFEHEWTKAFNKAIDNVVIVWPLQVQHAVHAVPVTRFPDAKNVVIFFSAGTTQTTRTYWNALQNSGMLDQLAAALPAFSIRPDASFPPLDGTVCGSFTFSSNISPVSTPP